MPIIYDTSKDKLFLEGIKQGIKQGRKEQKVLVIKRMSSMKLSVDIICLVVQMTKEEVLNIQKK